MIRKRIKFLAVGFDYVEMNQLQDKIADAFTHFEFSFALSVRDSLFRMNVPDYQVVVFDLTHVNTDDIINLKKVYNSIEGVTTFVVLKEDEYSKLSEALGINFQYFILKDEDYFSKLVSLIQNVIGKDQSVSTIELGLSTNTRSLFQSLINTVSQQVFAIGSDYRLKLVNHEILKRCECMMEDVVGQRCFEFFYNLDKPCSDEKFPCPLKKILVSGESCKVVHNPKEDVELHISAFPMTNEFNEIVEILIAVNRETKSSDALFDKNLLNSLVNGFSEGLLFCDHENIIQLMNEAAVKYLGIEENFVFGKTIFKIPLGKGLHWLGKVLQNAKSSKSESSTANIHVNEKQLLLRFEPLYRNDDQYIGGFLYVIEKTDKEVKSIIDADIINISKFFSSKIIAEG